MFNLHFTVVTVYLSFPFLSRQKAILTSGKAPPPYTFQLYYPGDEVYNTVMLEEVKSLFFVPRVTPLTNQVCHPEKPPVGHGSVVGVLQLTP